MIPMDTPNREKQQKRQELAADVEAFLAKGGTIQTSAQGYAPLAKGPEQADHISTTSAAALLGFSEAAILQSFRTGLLGGHPAPEFIKHRATSARMYLREAVYQWRERYGKGGSKGVPKSQGADDPMLTLLETTQLTGLSRPTIYKYMNAGRFPQNVKGADKRKYWRRSDVDQWLKESRRAAA